MAQPFTTMSWISQTGLNGINMQKQVYLADPHFGHGDKIMLFRPQFSSGEEHDEYVVHGINEVANPNDTLVLLGDVLVKESGIKWIEKIRCKNIILIPGNHDGERCAIPHHLFRTVIGSKKIIINEQVGVCTHIPIHPLSLDRWSFNVHGHLHDKKINDPRYVCVSCEQTNYKPVTKEWILSKLIK